MRILMPVLLCLLALGLTSRLSAADLSDEDTKKAEDALKRLDTDDVGQRTAAESDLRGMGAKILPVLSKSKLNNDAARVRVREMVVDMTIESSKITKEDGNMVAQVAREEALSKRYASAGKCYRRAQQIYQGLKDDARSRKDKVSKQEFEDLEKRNDKRADKAELLAKGGTERTGLNLGIVHIGSEKNASDDQDW